MHGDTRMIDESLEELADQIDIEIADARSHKIDIEFQSGATRQINDYARQGLVQRDIGMAVTRQPLLVAERLRQCLAERDTDILDRVVCINVQVTARIDLQVDQAMTGDLIQHVVKETDACRQLRLAGTLQVELDADLGFQRGAVNVGGALYRSHDGVCPCFANGCKPGDNTISSFPQPPLSPAFDPVMSRFWSATTRALQPYVPGEQPKLPNLVKLNTNENPYGPSPKVCEVISREIGDGLRLYPDPNGERLKSAIAAYFGDIEPRNVFVGNGSDEVLAHVFLGLLKHDQPILFPDISYSFYPVYCGLYDIKFATVPLDAEFAISVDDYRRPNGGIIFPNPNAPTGRLLPLDEIARLLDANPDSVVVIDEAYIDFGAFFLLTLH